MGDYLRHLSIANGSLMELETHLQLLSRLSYLTDDKIENAMILATEVGKMLAGLDKSLRRTNF
jgi:four helix bundle protein